MDDQARALYEAQVAERGPRWEQLGETTKDVWRERANNARDGSRLTPLLTR